MTGTRSQLAANLLGLLTPDGNGNVLAAQSPAQFDSSLKLATMASVQQALGNFSGSSALSASTVLTGANAGHFYSLGGPTAGQTITLPLMSSVPIGYTVGFMNGGVNTWAIKGSGSDLFGVNTGAAASIAVPTGDQVTLMSDGSYWRLVSGSVALAYSSLIGSSINQNGYQKLPSGIVIQWGVVSVTTATSNGGQYYGSASVTFPLTFPTGILNLSAGMQDATGALPVGPTWQSQSATGFTQLVHSQTNGQAWNVSWFAVGH